MPGDGYRARDADERRRGPNLGAARLLLLVGALLLGVATAAAAMPWAFRRIPTDISRVGVLLGALRDPELRPQVAVLGNSAIMSGIDARRLRDELPGRPLALNLASTAQSLTESFLLQQALPASVTTLVQYVALDSGERRRPLDPQRYNAFYMYGFRPTARTRTVLDGIFGPPVVDLLERSDLSQRFQARWALRQLVDTQLRILLRRDLTLAEAERDLHHPQRYTTPVEAVRLRSLIDPYLAEVGETGLEFPDENRRLLAFMAHDAAAAGRRLVVLLPPIHPAVRSALGDQLRRPLADLASALAQDGIAFVDATDALEEAHFIDNLHPTDEGAVVLTRLLARQLAGLP